jgi:hypothetical protein
MQRFSDPVEVDWGKGLSAFNSIWFEERTLGDYETLRLRLLETMKRYRDLTANGEKRLETRPRERPRWTSLHQKT